MNGGLGLGILLICLVQAEPVCSSWSKKAPILHNSNTHAGFPLPDGRQSKFSSSSNLQNQLRQGLSSPRLAQTSSLHSNPSVNSGHGWKLSTSGFMQGLSQPVQGSGRLVKKTSMSKYNSQNTGLTASLFGPVGPGPRSSVEMRTYARGRARKVPSKASSFSPQATAGKSNLNPQLALNVGGYGPRSRVGSLASPRSSKAGESAPGYAPVEIHELPENLGGTAIRRLAQPTVSKPQQLYTPPQGVQVYTPARTSIQNQKPHQMSSTPPPRWVPAYNPDPLSVHPVSKWTKVKRPYRL